MKHSHYHRFSPFIICIFLIISCIICPKSLLAKSNEKELFLVAQKAFQDGFYDVAIRYIEQLVKEHPQTQKRVQANLLLGQCYFFQSQYLKAYDIFNELLNYTDYKDATLFWLGETFLKGADYKQAEKQYKQLISLYPKSTYAPQAYYSLGWNYFERENYNDAKAMFVELIARFPKHQLSEDAAFKLGETEYNLQNYEDAIDFFSQYVFEYKQSRRKAEALFYIGESYYYLEKYLDAVTYYAKASELAYDKKLTLMSQISLGWSYLKLKKYNLSEQHFEQAEQFANEKQILSDDVYLGQATLYSDTQQHNKALKAYEHLIKAFPDSKRTIDALLGKANIHYLLEDYALASKAYLSLIEKLTLLLTQTENVIEKRSINEIFEKAYFGLAWSYLKDGLIDKSIKTFEAIKNKTDNNTVKISALTQIGDAYQDIGQLEKAIDVYDQILKSYPDSIYIDYVQYRQGIALLKMDNIQAATLSFQTLKSNFKNSKYLHDVHYYLGVAYFKKEDWGAARSEIEKFINDQTTNQDNFLVESYFILGLSQYNL
ncbi:tetratricopeptide repeat protein, partial [Candidatus Omnitrophota bacterium]